MLEYEIPEEKKRENKVRDMFNRESEKDIIDESTYQADRLGQIFYNFLEFTSLVISGKVTQENIYECEDLLNELRELIDHSSKTNSEQFNFLFQFIWVLNNRNDFKTLKNQLIYMTNKLIENYPDLIENFLSSEEITSFIDIYSGIFLTYEEKLLSNVIDASENALNVLISNNLLDTIFKGIISTVLQIFPDFEKEDKITDKSISIEYYDSKRLIFNYWLFALKILQKISAKFMLDNSVQIAIFKFCIKFISIEFYTISPGFFFKVIDCISSCITHFETLEMFNVDYYLPFLLQTLNGDYFEARESIFNLFNIITQPPFLYKWDQETILSVSSNAIIWYKSKDYQNYFQYFSKFIDFISNVIHNQYEIFDILYSASILDEIFIIFEYEALKSKFHIINLFMNLAYPQIWPKSVTFFAKNQIITELLTFVSSVQIDPVFLMKIISCLLQISDENFLNPYPSEKAAIVMELQSDVAQSAFECFENEYGQVSEMISTLKEQINSL